MYINPFLAGIISTIFAEMALVLVYAIFNSFKK